MTRASLTIGVVALGALVAPAMGAEALDWEKLLQARAQADAAAADQGGITPEERRDLVAGDQAYRASLGNPESDPIMDRLERVAAHQLATPRRNDPDAALPTISEADAEATFRSVLVDLLGEDTARQVVAETLAAPDPAAADASVDHLWQAGSGGLLWIIWAVDAPGIERMVPQLGEVATQHPGVRVHDLHLMPLSGWLEQARWGDELNRWLATNDPTMDEAQELQAKTERLERETTNWRAFTVMARSRRSGGYLLYEDPAVAEALDVRRIPLAVFLSPGRVLHRRAGIGEDGLAAWMQRCLEWEEEHAEILAKRRQLHGAEGPGGQE